MENVNRTELLFGESGVLALKNAHVCVIGLGGVGGITAEALVRSGVGSITLIDKDTVESSNKNRQIIALNSCIGTFKADALKNRLLDINESLNVTAHKTFYLPDTADQIDFSLFDYVIDAVDTITAKIEIVVRAKATGVKVISCMGTGGKSNPLELKVADIYSTSVCPLAKVMRKELKNRGIESLKVVYSTETLEKENKFSKTNPCSTMFVPATAGLIMANEVIKDLVK